MSNIETTLQASDMGVSRTPQELCDWVNSKTSELVKSVKSIVQSEKLDFRAVFLLGGTGNYLACVSGKT